MRDLLSAVNEGRLRFLDSAWLHHELELAEPAALRRKLLRHVPIGYSYIAWERSIARDARLWALNLNLDADESGWRDCRHLICAIRGGASHLITFDKNFHEAMRQHAAILKWLHDLKPVWLPQWQEQLDDG